MQKVTERKLGLWETICKFAHDFYHGTGNVVAIAEVSGELDPNRIKQSLQLLFERHPLLHAIITERWYQCYFTYQADFNDIPLTLVTDQTLQQWPDYVELEMREPFNIEKYLWRGTLLSDANNTHHFLLFTFHHAIADGLATAQFIDELLTIYNLVSSKQFSQVEKLPSLSNIENMLQQKSEWPIFIANKTAMNEQIPNKFPFQQFTSIANRICHNIYVECDSNFIHQLKSACVLNHTTINSALNAALLMAIHQLEPDLTATTLNTPVNLRHHCEPQIMPEQLGCYISMVTTVHKNLQMLPSFWKLAQSYQQQLHHNIPTIGYCPAEFDIANFDIVELTRIFDMAGSTKRQFFTSGFGISNLGQLQFSSWPNHKILSFRFCTNRMMGDFIVFVNVTTVNNTLYFCFTYTEPLLTREWMEQLTDHFFTILKNEMTKTN